MSISSLASLVSLGANLLSTPKGIFSAKNEKTGRACWTTLSVKSVEIDTSTSNTGNPLSQGQQASQSTTTNLLAADVKTIKIINPTRLKITCLCKDASSVSNIISVFADIEATVAITTKGLTAISMAVQNITIEQTPEMVSACKVIIDLEKVTPNPAAGYNPSQSANASATSSISQTISSAVSSVSSAASTVTGLVSKVSNFISGS